jgi:RimJ/RimL family protein N-acetyltransferase
VIVDELDPADTAPGSTLRPHRRYRMDGASVVCGQAEVYEDRPLVWALARWRFDDPMSGRAVLDAATADGPKPLYVPFNAEGTPDCATRRELLEAAGYALDYEKEAVRWADDGRPLPEPVLTLTEDGGDALPPLVDACQAVTRDRIDARFPVPAARYLAAHPGSWFVARDAGGEAVGFVGLTPRDGEPDVATIALIGVRPDRRGHGYGSQIVDAAYREARTAGYRGVLSFVDVLNTASRRALSRHGGTLTEWHRYVYVKHT